jgi:predicted metal-dependent hydrolase
MAANHALGIAHFNAGRFFQAHEAWEEAWRKAENTPDEEFFKGLAQLGAAYTHYARGNAHGARVLLERALERVSSRQAFPNGPHLASVIPKLREQAIVFASSERSGDPLPEIEPPKL